MSKLKETRVSTKPVFKGRLLDVRLDEVRLPNGKNTTREYIIHPGAVVMIPVLPDGNIVLIRQYRYPMGREFIELPAGKLDPGESPRETADRELEEEIGYRAGKLTELVEIHPCIGYSNERMWLYLAEELVPTKTNTDHDEFIELLPMPVEKAVDMVWAGKITDVKTIIGILWADRLLR
ncbi:MAG: NUDIX hydrolase [FCB group bacterium]|nr:NUDIX hydrolase [FCB group bacterium]